MAIERYHLRFWPEEDRASISVDTPAGERVFFLTRRLTRDLCRFLRDRIAASVDRPELSPTDRGIILDFERQAQLTQSIQAKKLEPLSPMPAQGAVAAASLVKMIHLVPDTQDAIRVVFADGQQELAIRMDRSQQIVFFDRLVNLANLNGWDFPDQAVPDAGTLALPADHRLQ